MEIDIFDSALEHEHGIASICLNDEIKLLQNKYHAQIKDIKPISSSNDGRNFIVAIFYEKPSIIQEHSVLTRMNGEKINDFMGTHDVIKTDHTPTDGGDVVTTITYRVTDNSYGDFEKWKKASGQNEQDQDS